MTIYNVPPNVSDVTVTDDSTMNVNNGGTATSVTVADGSVENIYSGGIASYTHVSSGADDFVHSGGIARFTIVSGGGETGGFEIVSGGTASNTTVLKHGNQYVDAGIASNTDLLGGFETLYGGSSVDTQVESAGIEYVYNGASAISTTVSTTFAHISGTVIVLSGGTTSGTILNGLGIEEVHGTAIDTVLDIPSVISSAGENIVYANEQSVYSGGTATGTTVNSADSEYVYSGGSATSTTVYSGGLEEDFGATIGDVLSGGEEDVGVQLGGVGTATATGTIVDSGFQSVDSGGSVTSTTVNSGGYEEVFSGGSATSITVNSGSYEYVFSGGVATSTTVDSGGVEVIASSFQGSGFGSATQTDLLSGGTIDLTFLSYTNGGSASVDPDDLLTVSVGGQVYTQQLVGNYTGDPFYVTPDGKGGTDVALCFCHETLIATPSGQVKVQDLVVGDTVLTQHGPVRPIVWIGTGAVLATRGRRNAATPVIVRKGALADNVPTQDLRVTKSHSLLVDGALIPVEFLVNHRSIEWDDQAQEVRLYHIELETHDVLIANGAPAESYRDDGNRWLFRNANTGWAEPPKPACAPVLTGGPLVDAAWRRLLDRSGPRPNVPMTDDPDLHLVVDGRCLDATGRDGDEVVFTLADRPTAVRIVSRASAPQELGFARDPRCLGVALRRVMVRQGSRFSGAEANDPALVQGFHGFEADNRCIWTNGDAAFPMALLDGLTGPLEIILTVAGRTNYIDSCVRQTEAGGTGSVPPNRYAA